MKNPWRYAKRILPQLRYLGPKTQCSYLPDQISQMEYEIVFKLSPEEYRERLGDRWRRFGSTLFRPQCPSCDACVPIRTIVSEFEPNRSQKRVIKANAGITTMEIAAPSVSEAKLDLYYRHHLHHAEQKGWPLPTRERIENHLALVTDACYPTQEWTFYRDQKPIGVIFVDQVTDGLSGVYFYFDPDYRKLSPGTWMCLSMIDRAMQLGLPYAYLGYLVRGCRSMEYKASFKPYELRGGDGAWHKET
jgi:leucyl-tRNA---protein transferase